MEVGEIRALYAYNTWVNNRLLDVASGVPAEVLRDRHGATFASIHDNFAHILGAQISWLSRWRGTSPARLPAGDDFADLAAIREKWVSHQADLDRFLARLTPEQLAGKIRYVNFAGQPFAYRLWQMLVHVVNHGTHHRGEIAELLTRAGHPPPPTDFLVYYDAIEENS